MDQGEEEGAASGESIIKPETAEEEILQNNGK